MKMQALAQIPETEPADGPVVRLPKFFGIRRAVVNFGPVMIRNRSTRSAGENEKKMPRRHEMRYFILIMNV